MRLIGFCLVSEINKNLSISNAFLNVIGTFYRNRNQFSHLDLRRGFLNIEQVHFPIKNY